jgi:hypothetical protein
MPDKLDPMLLLAGKFPTQRKKARVSRQEGESAAAAGPPVHEEDEETPPSTLSSSGAAQAVHKVKAQPPTTTKFSTVPLSMSLVDRCREVIVTNLERFPPYILGVLDPQEWDALIIRRHAKTKPTKGSQGLDGTGRLTPAVSEKFISAVEDASPYLVTPLTDVLVWKDCVNFRFRPGSLTRPKMLQVPWPDMVEQIQSLGKILEERGLETPHNVIQALEAAPMSILLLQATGIGKTVKKVIKTISKRCNSEDDSNNTSLERLRLLLQEWKELVGSTTKQKDEEDWELAESIHSWKELYAGLKNRQEKTRTELGQKMRKNRASLDKGRPSVVKVRPMKRQHELILSRQSAQGGEALGHTLNPKLEKLRQETAILAQRMSKTPATNKTSFARAVSVAGCAQRKAYIPSSSFNRSKRTMKTAPPPPLPARGGYKPQTKPSPHKPAF